MNHYSYMRSCERYDDDEVDPCLAANVRLRKQYCFGLSRLKFYLCLVASLLLIILLSLLLLFFLYRDYVPLFSGAKDFTTAGNESTTPTTTSPPTRASTSPSIASQTHSPSTAVKIEASSRAPTEPTSLPPSVVVKVEESTEATTPTPTEATTPSPTEATTPPPTEATTPPPTEATTPPPTKATTPSPTKATTPPPTKATSPPTSSAPVRIKPTTSSPFPETTTAASIKKSTSSPTTKPFERNKSTTSKKPAVPPTTFSATSSTNAVLKPKEKGLLPAVRQENVSVVNFFLDGHEEYKYVSTPFARESCDEHFKAGYKESGVYKLHGPTSSEEFYALCLMDNSSGWNVLQRRTGNEWPFWNNSFTEYATGFGDAGGDHWLGLERVYAAAKKGLLRLRVLLYGDSCIQKMSNPEKERNVCSGLGDTGFWWADWEFSIAGKADSYRLKNVKFLQGNLSSVEKDFFLEENNNMRFTTIDADNDAFDKKNCARWHERGAWWHKECTKISLNGKYIESDGRFRGLAWHYENSKNASMYYNIKPKNSLMMYQYI